ncbi:sigma-54-dependent transcriptional regulator [Lichenibacterium dinghuense]|uniref:sigma-54-dependent transcriptional regulator n=1 Tax=Lichenibacterium dinghuense TaxID=2895977 RepID=UPI001F260F8B|nr:sigma-54 dependent transcriptional regulator [Lichenibacterium sp. 6Y81]
MARVLIVDDDEAFRDALADAVRDLGHDVREAASGREGDAAAAEGGIDAVILDLRMPGMDGLEVLRRIRARPAPPPVVILTAHAAAANTIEAMRLGAVDHLTKPIASSDLRRALDLMLAHRDADAAPAPAVADDLVGSSAAMRAVQKTIGLVADRDDTVLVTGETGTGKEVVARAIHRHGRRSGGPFVAVNCAAIPRDLLESELFGHARGAFTGAAADRAGAFRDAHGGTLFLDEIGDMDPAMQAKILRTLQERVVTPVGGRPAPVDVRVVAATHRDLGERVREGAFREDLYYRLAVVPVHLPPLRERAADILPLAEHFLRQVGGPPLDAGAAGAIVGHAWPGNVRELRNVVQRLSALVRGRAATAADLDLFPPRPAPGAALDWPDEDLPSAIARLEEFLIRRALDRSAGNRTEAARMLNIRRQHLYSKLERYGLGLSGGRTEAVPDDDS